MLKRAEKLTEGSTIPTLGWDISWQAWEVEPGAEIDPQTPKLPLYCSSYRHDTN
jgi:hypothetical protein